MIKLFVFTFCLFTISNFAVAGTVTLTDTGGRSLQCELIAVKNEAVDVMKDRKRFSIPLAKLNDESRELIEKWAASPAAMSKKMKVKAVIVRGNRKDKAEDYDDRIVTVTPKITVSNEDRSKATAPANLTTIIFAKPVMKGEGSSLYVASTQTVQLPSIAANQDRITTMKSSTLLYDNKEYAKFGHRYYGHISFVQIGGEVVAKDFHPYSMGNLPPTSLLKLKPKYTYKSDLSDVPRDK